LIGGLRPDVWNEDHYFRAKALELSGDKRRARAIYRKAQDKCRNQRRRIESMGRSFLDSEAYLNAALAEKGLGNLERARGFLHEALRCYPGNHTARRHLQQTEA
jgi:tetratricopeptide (TPR) repeat protein